MERTIVTITGHKHTKKDEIAKRLAKNSEVTYICPYTDKPKRHPYQDEIFGHNFVTKEELDYMIRNEKLLCMTTIDKNRYCFFESQLETDFTVLIADDYAVVDIKSNFNGRVFTVRLVSDKEEQSDRVGEYLYKHEFDVVFDVDRDDFYDLENKIEWMR